jgi:hypothetical protein
MSDQNKFVFSPFNENFSEGKSCSSQQYGQMDGQRKYTTVLISALSNSEDVTKIFNRKMSYKNNRPISTALASSFSSTGLNERG